MGYYRRSMWRKISTVAFWFSLLTFSLVVILINDLNNFGSISSHYPAKSKTKINHNRVLKVDRRPPPPEHEQMEDVGKHAPNLPVEYHQKIHHVLMHKHYHNSSCASFPDIFKVKFSSNYWQVFNTSNGTFYLYRAYYDTRNAQNPALRILALIDKYEPSVETYFQIWFDMVAAPVIIPTSSFEFIWYPEWGTSGENDQLQPYLISAYVNMEYLYQEPKAVSIVERMCDQATNCLKVLNERPEQLKNVAVCVKGLDFVYSDLSVKLVEWLELLKLIGIDKVFMYKMNTHNNITKVLKHYEREGFVEVTPITVPGDHPYNIPVLRNQYMGQRSNTKRKTEIIPYNDCLYKNLYKYKYIIPMDIDEVIVPVHEHNINDLIHRLELEYFEKYQKKPDNIYARNIYFLEKFMQAGDFPSCVPEYMHILRHIYRSEVVCPDRKYVKSIMNVGRVLLVHNHLPIKCLHHPYCDNLMMDPESEGRLQHYRTDCNAKHESCEEYSSSKLRDIVLWKYKESLMANTDEILENLGFFQK